LSRRSPESTEGRRRIRIQMHAQATQGRRRSQAHHRRAIDPPSLSGDSILAGVHSKI